MKIRTIYIYNFVIGFALNLLVIFAPYYLLGNSAVMEKYLSGDTIGSVVTISIPYIFFSILIGGGLLYLRDKRVNLSKFLFCALFNIIGFYLAILALFGVAYKVFSGMNLL